MSILVLGLETYLALLLGASSLVKIVNPQQFALTLRHQHILPQWSIPIISYLIPWTELLIAIALMLGIMRILVGTLVFGLFICFLAVKIALFLKKSSAGCGCNGGLHSDPVDAASLVVAIIFVATAAAYLWLNTWVVPAPWQWQFTKELVLCSLGSWLLLRIAVSHIRHLWRAKKQQNTQIAI